MDAERRDDIAKGICRLVAGFLDGHAMVIGQGYVNKYTMANETAMWMESKS